MGDKNFNNIKIFSINDIVFTQRELDVMSCILCGRNVKSTSTFLSSVSRQINQRSVETHAANIRRKIHASSRNGIIDFLERYPESYAIVREHYYFLREKSEVDKLLKKKLPELLGQTKKKVSIFGSHDDNKFIVISELIQLHLQNFIELIDLSSESEEDFPNLSNYDNAILIASPATYKIIINILDQQCKINSDLSRLIIVSNDIEHPSCSTERGVVYLKENKPYYELFFDIVAEIFHNPIIKKLYQLPHDKLPKKKEFDLKKYSSSKGIKIKFLFLVIIVVCMIIYLLYKNDKVEFSNIDFPHFYTLIDRNDVLEKMNSAIVQQSSNKSIILVGPSGSGKNIIAKTFAQKQKNIDIIYEIDAENIEKVRTAFEKLAFTFAQNDNQKKIFQDLITIPYSEERDKIVMDFIKQKFIASQGWIIIYNNVSQDQNLEKFDPLHFQSWGKGISIITTQDSNFRKNHHMNSVIKVPPLTDAEKTTLFSKILTRSGIDCTDHKTFELLKNYLQDIPPYPLDIQIGAHYFSITNPLKNNGRTNIQNQNLRTNALYKEVALKNFGVQTRENIIFAALDNIIKEDPSLLDILFLVSVVGHNKIPRAIVDYCSPELGYDYFIYKINKYSFFEINLEDQDNSFNINSTIQKIIKKYCFNKIPNSELSNYFVKIHNVFQLIEQAILGQDILEAEDVISHYHSILQYQEMMSDEIFASFLGRVGISYLLIRDYANSKTFLVKAMSIMKNLNKRTIDYARFGTSLGIVYESLGDYNNALRILNDSIALQSSTPHNKDILLLTQSTVFLGLTQIELGLYHDAKISLEKALHVGLQDKNWQNSVIHVKNLDYLAAISRIMGEYEEAKALYNKSISIQKEYFSKNIVNIASTELQLAMVNLSNGNLKEAHLILDRIHNIYTKYFSHEHPIFGLLQINLGYLYQNYGNLLDAKNWLVQAENNAIKNFGKMHIRLGWIYNLMTIIAIKEQKLDSALDYIKKAEQIYMTYKQHPSYYLTLKNKAHVLSLMYNNSIATTKSPDFLIRQREIEKLVAQSKKIILTTFPDNEKRKKLLSELSEIKI